MLDTLYIFTAVAYTNVIYFTHEAIFADSSKSCCEAKATLYFQSKHVDINLEISKSINEKINQILYRNWPSSYLVQNVHFIFHTNQIA